MKLNIGSYTHYTNCRFCDSQKVTNVLNLGYMPLAGGFLKKNTTQKEFNEEKLYPLTLKFCSNCLLLQCDNAVNADVLFKNYFYFSSKIPALTSHFQSVVETIPNMIAKKNPFIIEIGCNDGAFLKELVSNGYKALGVDPAQNITKPLIKQGLPIVNDYFTNNLAKRIVKNHSKADAIYSFHAMAHIEDMHDVIHGVKTILKKDGYLAMEVHYLGDLLKETQYDMIYHEHQFYYSFLSLKNFFKLFDMEIFDVKHSKIRAGSMTYYVQNVKTGSHKITNACKLLEREEKNMGIHKVATYISFANYIEKTKKNLIKIIEQIKNENGYVVGYGASGRGTVIANYCNLNKNLLDLMVDDAPAKHGAYMPGTHQKIYSSKKLIENPKSTYAVLFAWPFIDDVITRNANYIKQGGKFIVPLPQVKVV